MKKMNPDNLNQFQNYYSASALWEKLKKQAARLGKEAVYQILVLYYLLKDKNTPWEYKSMILGALGYLILPVDLIPDTIPIAGYSDDLAAIAAVYKAVKACINPEVEGKAKAKLNGWFA